ncbi:MAG: putative nucleotidyltransferase [Arcobacteraceae bacterium]|jgi:predicted nucleotidyltransferase
MDLLKATYLLFGDCHQLSNGDIIVKGRKLTSKQLEEVTIKAAELLKDYELSQYRRNRVKAYASLNQDELRFNDLENATTTWQDSINAIKKQFPKPD